MLARSEKLVEQEETGSSLFGTHRELFERSRATSCKPNTSATSSEKESFQQDPSGHFLHMLAPLQQKELYSASEELSALNRLTSIVGEAVQEGILSEAEAESLLRHALSRFLEKRLDEVVEGLFSKTGSKWFLAASHRFHGRSKE